MKNNQMNYEMNEENIYQNRRNTLTTDEVKKIVHEINKLPYPSKKLKIDPEFKHLISPLDDYEYQLLKENIKQRGCSSPINTWNDTIVDGHHRYQICSELEIPFKVEKLEFEDKFEAKIWMAKNQCGRRNISLYEKGMLVLPMKDELTKRAKENIRLSKLKKNLVTSCINVADQLSKLAGIGNGTMSRILKIDKFASQEDKEDLKSGKVAITQVYEKIRRKELSIKNLEYLNKRSKINYRIKRMYTDSMKILFIEDLNKYDDDTLKSIYNIVGTILSNYRTYREQGEL